MTRSSGNANKATTIQVKAKPHSRKSMLALQFDGTWIAYLKSPPVDGKANEELIRLVADHFEVPKSSVSIKTGSSGRLKRVVVDWPALGAR